MRGTDTHQQMLFSYISPEARVPQDHPLRPIRKMTDKVILPAIDRHPVKRVNSATEVIYHVHEDKAGEDQCQVNTISVQFSRKQVSGFMGATTVPS